MAIEMPRVTGHPNREPFRGVLTLVDVVSDKAPAGARGHRVVLTRSAAEAGLASLLGMGLDYSRLSTGTMPAERSASSRGRRSSGRKIELGGYLFAKDFPEIVREIGRGGGLVNSAAIDASGSRRHKSSGSKSVGMSYEISGCAGRGHAEQSMDAHASDIYRRGNSAARQGGVPGYVDRVGVRAVLRAFNFKNKLRRTYGRQK